MTSPTPETSTAGQGKGSGRKPRPAHKRILDVIQTGIMYGALAMFRAVDVDRASAMGAWLTRRLMARRLGRASTVRTIRTAFPEMPDAAISDLVSAMAGRLGAVAAEIAHLDEFTGEAGRRRFRFEGLEHLEAARARGRPMIIVSGHFGNFELIVPALGHLGIATAAVARPPNNRFIADWIYRKRMQIGLTQFTNDPHGTRQLLKWLRTGNVLMLVDQRVGSGIPVPLFGKPALTTPTPATLAIDLGVTLLPMALRRDRGANFTAVFHPPIRAPQSGNDARDVFAMTRAINAFIEDEVRARPTDWLWMHQRWKPIGELSRRAERLVKAAGASADDPAG